MVKFRRNWKVLDEKEKSLGREVYISDFGEYGDLLMFVTDHFETPDQIHERAVETYFKFRTSQYRTSSEVALGLLTLSKKGYVEHA